MNRYYAAFGPALVLLLAVLARAEEPPQFGGLEKQTVVLRNGRVLEGHVIRRDERLEIGRVGQSVVRIPVTLVDFIAPNLHVAYQHQSSRLKDEDTDARIRLVEWCLQNDLLREAGEQHAVIRYLDADHPKFEYLTRRLELSQRQANPVSPPVKAGASPEQNRPITPAELARFTKEMPPGTVEQFTHVIQPMLVNRCGAAACHGVRSDSDYRLVQPSMSGAFSHRYTQRNLYSTVQELRKRNLVDSAWIAAATRPHGGHKEPLFGEKEIDNLQNLVTWARSIGPAPRKLSAAAIATAQLAAPLKKPARVDTGVRPASFYGFRPESKAKPNKQGDADTGAYSGPARVKTPADPFDPSEFNRQRDQ